MKNLQIKRLPLMVLLFLCWSGNNFAQVLVYGFPLDSIELEVKADPQYLIDLNQKCIHADSVLTINDYFDLYYGSAYLHGYSPYGEGVSGRVIEELLDEQKYTEVISTCDSQILSHPGFIRPFYYLGIAYDQMGDTSSARKFFNRFYEYLSIPFYSGTGESADSAMVVRCVDDEYLIVGEMGLSVQSQALIFENNLPFDLLNVVASEDTTSREIYFNIAQPYILGLSIFDETDTPGKETKKEERKQKRNRNKKSRKSEE